jgi:excisionase family DNA binding protein
MTRRLRQKQYLKPREVASLLRVEPGTVRSWTQDGRLRATTTPGGHRRFSYRDVEMFAREHGISLPQQAGDELRVLVVDDDKRLARTFKNMLASADLPIDIEVAHDGFAAGQTVEKFEPHVLILDLIMPGIDGFELCKSLKKDPARSDVRIIAVTGDPSPAAAKRIISLGAEVCLMKPVKKKELLAAVGI